MRQQHAVACYSRASSLHVSAATCRLPDRRGARAERRGGAGGRVGPTQDPISEEQDSKASARGGSARYGPLFPTFKGPPAPLQPSLEARARNTHTLSELLSTISHSNFQPLLR